MKAAVPQIAPVPFLLLPLLAATARDGTGPQYFDTRTCGPTLQDLNPAGREVHPKWAFVFAHDLHVEPNASELSQAFHLLRHFHPQPQGPQIVFLHPQPDATGSPQLTPLLREALQRHSVRPIAKTMPQVRCTLLLSQGRNPKRNPPSP